MMSDEDKMYPTVEINGRELKRQELLPEEIAHKVKGKTLEIYYFLVTNQGKYGVTEIQDALDYSTPSLVSYHLNRLLDFELIQKTKQGQYFIEGEPEKLGELKNHITFAGMHVPRIMVYGYHGLLSILFSIIFLFLSADIRVWAVYFIVSNLVFLGLVFKDAINTASNLNKYKQQ